MDYIIDHDFHIHTGLSKCSKDENQNKENILSYGIKNDYKKLCLTDHFWDETVPVTSRFYNPQNFEHVSSVLPLPEADGIKMYFGCETEMDKNMRLGIADTTIDKFDFVIVPTTHLHMTGLTIDEKDSSLERRTELYIKRFDALLNMDLPFHKIGIAHLTCSLMAPADFSDHLKLLSSIEDSVFEELFRKSCSVGIGIELNISPFLYTEAQLDTIFRPYEIAKKCGCKFYMGSDAHHPEEFEQAGFDYIAHRLKLTENDKFDPFK